MHYMGEWRTVPGFKNYEINIDTKEGKCRTLNYKKTGQTRELSNKPSIVNGRINWCLYNEDGPKYGQPARWIAFTYPELVQNEYFEGAEIDHIDTDPLNNHPSNLRWVTRSGNLRNTLTIKHISEANKNKPSLSHRVEQHTLEGEFIASYPSEKEAERQTGVNHSNISKCCKGERKTADMYTWSYVEQ